MAYEKDDVLDWLHLFEFENDGEGHCPDWKLYKSPAAKKLLCKQVENMGAGLLSVSHFIIAFQELKVSGQLTQLRQPEPTELTLTADDYRRISASDTTRRYRSEPEFRACVDRLIQQGEI